MRPLIIASLLALSGCQTIHVPSCEEVLRAADTVEEIAELLEARGIESATAAKVAAYVRQGRFAVTAACALGF